MAIETHGRHVVVKDREGKTTFLALRQHMPVTLSPGGFNDVVAVSDGTGRVLVARTIRQNPEWIDWIKGVLTKELTAVGFLPEGTLGFRDHEEQVLFARRLEIILPVIAPEFTSPTHALTNYHEGISLKEYIMDGKTYAVGLALDDILKAHRHGIIYGDRTPSNVHVVDNGQAIKQLDFDIKIDGPHARELDVVRLLFGVIEQSKSKLNMVRFLDKYFSGKPHVFASYDIEHMVTYLNGYVKFFESKIKPEVGEAVEDVCHILRGLKK